MQLLLEPIIQSLNWQTCPKLRRVSEIERLSTKKTLF